MLVAERVVDSYNRYKDIVILDNYKGAENMDALLEYVSSCSAAETDRLLTAVEERRYVLGIGKYCTGKIYKNFASI